MAVPVQVTFRDMPPSDALTAHVEKRAAKLENFYFTGGPSAVLNFPPVVEALNYGLAEDDPGVLVGQLVEIAEPPRLIPSLVMEPSVVMAITHTMTMNASRSAYSTRAAPRSS